MFSGNQALVQFLKSTFPELEEKLLFGLLVPQDKKNDKNVVLFTGETLAEETRKNISDLLLNFPHIVNVTFKEAGLLPLTDIILLSSIKQHQPIQYEQIVEQLSAKKISFEDKELKRMLDKLRKAGMLFRNSEGLYNVTEDALGYIPHGNRNNSSDIKRLLEMGKRKW